MEHENSLGEKVRQARERKGWSVYAACEKMPSVGRESLARIESGRTDPTRLQFQTALELIELFWPELDIEDFADEEPLSRFTLKRRRALPKSRKKAKR